MRNKNKDFVQEPSTLTIGRQRKEEETYEEYKKRRTEENKAIKMHLKGKKVWNSDKQGTYIKNKQENKNNGKQQN